MASKARTPDWVRLAGAALDTRDGLRRALADLQVIIRESDDLDIRARATRVLEAVAREIDRLRHALKNRTRRRAA